MGKAGVITKNNGSGYISSLITGRVPPGTSNPRHHYPMTWVFHGSAIFKTRSLRQKLRISELSRWEDSDWVGTWEMFFLWILLMNIDERYIYIYIYAFLHICIYIYFKYHGFVLLVILFDVFVFVLFQIGTKQTSSRCSVPDEQYTLFSWVWSLFALSCFNYLIHGNLRGPHDQVLLTIGFR